MVRYTICLGAASRRTLHMHAGQLMLESRRARQKLPPPPPPPPESNEADKWAQKLTNMLRSAFEVCRDQNVWSAATATSTTLRRTT